MNYIGKFLYNFKEFYNEINSATLTGAIDVIVIKQDDGSYQCSPFHVRFGKIGVLRSREKIVDIEINGEAIDIHMKLGESGEAFFVQEADDAMVPMHLATSPIPSCPDIGIELEEMKKRHENLPPQNDMKNLFDTTDSWKDSKLVNNYLDTNSDSAEKSKIICSNQQRLLDLMEAGPSLESWPPQEITSFVDRLLISENTDHLNTNIDVTDVGASFNTSVEIPLNNTSTDSSTLLYSPDQLTTESSAINVPSNPFEQQDSLKDVEMKYSHSDTAISSSTLKSKSSSGSSRDQILDSEKIKKKRRKKKSTKNNKENISGEYASFYDGNDETERIFDMEVSDDEFEGVPTVVVRTASMPALSEDQLHWNFKSSNLYNIHPFSDGDVTPVISSPIGTRPPSPKSDSEIDKQMHDATCQTGEEIKWSWGELPKASPTKEIEPLKPDKKEKRTTFASMIAFHKHSKKLPESEGIYLDDLNLDELDPEVAALYFPRSGNTRQLQTIKDASHDDDTESGNGPSLPQSPHSVEGSIGGSRMVDSDGESKQSFYEYSGYQFSDMGLSLCGGLKGVDGNLPPDRFMQSLITYEDFIKNPNILFSPDLVIRIDGKYYNWQIAAPVIMSILVFQRPVPENVLSSLIKEHMPKKRSRMSSWFSWRRSPSVTDVKKSAELAQSPPSSSPPSATSSPRKSTTVERVKEEIYVSTSSENEAETLDVNKKRPIKERKFVTGQEKFKKSLRLTSDQIVNLNLKEGPNEMVFSVTTQYQGTSRCKCHLYLWRYDDKIVISDIDGTITKSDVLGHILPIIGRDWAQSGVAHLFTSIKKNGYQFLYLSARAIGQAHITREYLKSIKQGNVVLPDGPLLLSPSSLISALHREVIEKKPEEFKISCLRDIQALFPASRNPFYAGYGNKINDVWAYRAVGIPISRIFTINHRGELKHELTQTFQSSYTKLQELVDHVFPPLIRNQSGIIDKHTFDTAEEFSSFHYWREPLPDIVIELSCEMENNLEINQPSTSKS